MVESASDEILNGAQDLDVAFLVVGDPFGYAISQTGNLPTLTHSKGNYTYRPRSTSAGA
jgi:hypothetical protein